MYRGEDTMYRDEVIERLNCLGACLTSLAYIRRFHRLTTAEDLLAVAQRHQEEYEELRCRVPPVGRRPEPSAPPRLDLRWLGVAMSNTLTILRELDLPHDPTIRAFNWVPRRPLAAYALESIEDCRDYLGEDDRRPYGW
jgi:hypothetical protein